MLRKTLLWNTIWYRVGLGGIAIAVGGVLGFLITKLENPILPIAGVFGIIFALITVRDANFGLLALVFIVYSRFSDVMVNNNAPSILRPYIGLLILGIASRWIFQRELSRDWVRVTGFVLAYAVVVFTSLFYAANFSVASESGLDFLKDGVITIILVILINKAHIFRKVVWTLLIVGIFLGSISAYQGLTGAYDQDFWGFGRAGIHNIVDATEGNRVTGPMGDPNFYAQLMLVLIPLALNRMVSEKHWFLKIIAVWALAAISLAVVFTYSRGAVVAIMTMGLFAMLHRPPRISDMVLGILLFSILLTFLPSGYTERLATIPEIFGGENSLRGEVSFRGRASETITAWLMFLDHPIFGVGVNNYPEYYQKYSRTLGLDPRVEQRAAHNLYLQVAAETGLTGLLVFGWILWAIFSGMQKSWKRLRDTGQEEYAGMFLSFATGMLGYMAAAMFIHAAYPRYFWLLAGIALSIPQITDSLLTSEEKKVVNG